MAKKTTGMAGTDALFGKGEQQQPAEKTESAKREKMRSTFVLYADTIATLNDLKAHALRESGERVTFSDLLEEAIADLAYKRKLNQ